MAIRNWFKKGQRRSDGYDPDAKDERSGREHSARYEIRGTVLAEPLTDVTRKIRRSLLALSVLALVVNARLPIEKLPYVGEQPSETSIVTLLGVISIGVVYFLVNFIVSAGLECLSWRQNSSFHLLRQTTDWIRGIGEHVRRVSTQLDNADSNQKSSDIQKILQEAEEIIPDLTVRLRRTESYYVSTSRVQMGRVVVMEILLPVLVALVALSKVAALFWPMIVQIAYS